MIKIFNMDSLCGVVYIFSFLLIVQISVAQDIIETKTGEKIMAKVIDVGQVEIKYKIHNNMMGPMLKVDNQEVVVIRFANGKVKRFVPLPKPVNKMTQPEKYKVDNTRDGVFWEYQFLTDSIFSGNTIYYYGLDMSHLILINEKKADQDDELRGYLPSWHQKFNDIVTSDLIKRGLRTTKVVMKNEKVQLTHDQVDADWIKDNSSSLLIEEVIAIVSSFSKTIEENEGIGYLIILDNYYRPENKVRAVFTFFDVASGQILWASHVEGEARDNDLVKHWGFGMVRMYHNFRLAVYESGFKAYKSSKYNNKVIE